MPSFIENINDRIKSILSQIAANNKIVGPVGGDEYDFNFSSLFCASLGFLDFDARLDKKQSTFDDFTMYV